MSAESARVFEDITDPEAWGERTVARVSVSPWYRVANGTRERTVNLHCDNVIVWDRVRKAPNERWDTARRRTERTVCRMLREMMAQIDQLAL